MPLLPVLAALQTLTIFAAGTLAGPFHAIDGAFEKAHPGVTVQAQFGGSVKMVKQITELHERADVVGVADAHVIPKYLFAANGRPGDADWYVGFVGNAITFVYTDRAKGAAQLATRPWYDVLAEPGVQIGRSNPDTDPSGYQTLLALELASSYYHRPNLEASVLANAPQANMRDTETELIGALEAGQIDYLAMYRSDAVQHGFHMIDLPPAVNLSDAALAADYAKAHVTTANGTITGAPIVYAITIPHDAPSPQLALDYVRFLLGPRGRAAMARAGFAVFPRGYAVGAVPPVLGSLVTAWTPPR